jgi:hypothetical protein
MEPIIIESCRSTWIFEAERGRFRRVLKEIEVDPHDVVTPWQNYYGLELDPDTESFVVLLNPEGTRLLSSWRHITDCVQCGGHATAELSLENIRRQAHFVRAALPEEDQGDRDPTSDGAIYLLKREAS